MGRSSLIPGSLRHYATFFTRVIPASEGMYFDDPDVNTDLSSCLSVQHSSNRKVKILMTYIINTGLFSSICAMCILITVSNTFLIHRV